MYIHIRLLFSCMPSSLTCLHTAVPTPRFCGFWHGHSYIFAHFYEIILVSLVFHSTVHVYTHSQESIYVSTPNMCV